jgi:pimeloyl-ACP methyl ester carboxylesterase
LELGNRQAKHLLVFVHGSPGSLSVFEEPFFKDSLLLRHALILSFDRPGYGFSSFGKTETSIIKQAEALAWVLAKPQYQGRDLSILGSSYGGSVSLRLAMMPEVGVKKLFLLSASMIPGEEKIFSITPMTVHPLTRWLFPKVLRVASEEKLSHRKALEAIQPDWDKVTCPVVIMHGTNDRLIYPSNASQAEDKLRNAASVELEWFEGVGHRVVWDYPQMLIDKLHSLVLDEWMVEVE